MPSRACGFESRSVHMFISYLIVIVVVVVFVLFLIFSIHGFVELVLWDQPDPESAFQRRRRCPMCRTMAKVCLRPRS